MLTLIRAAAPGKSPCAKIIQFDPLARLVDTSIATAAREVAIGKALLGSARDGCQLDAVRIAHLARRTIVVLEKNVTTLIKANRRDALAVVCAQTAPRELFREATLIRRRSRPVYRKQLVTVPRAMRALAAANGAA